MRKVRARVEFVAAGGHLKGSMGALVVCRDPDGRTVTAGPGIIRIMHTITIIVSAII